MKTLTAENFFRANQVEYLKNNPEIMRKLIETEKKYELKDCFECIFFSIKYDEGAQCAVKPEIDQDAFEYGRIAEGCPLRE